MNDVVIFFDLFDTLIKINRGYLEEYFDDEIDLLGDKGILRNSEKEYMRSERNPWEVQGVRILPFQ